MLNKFFEQRGPSYEAKSCSKEQSRPHFLEKRGLPASVRMANSSSTTTHREWRFSQCFGETATQAEQSDVDILSAVEFDQSGRYLATGDRGGRIVVFETDKTGTSINSEDLRRSEGKKRKGNTEYRFYCEFQSHEPEFDYLKSLDIEEKINQIKWCPPCGGSLFLLSTNGKSRISISDKLLTISR